MNLGKTKSMLKWSAIALTVSLAGCTMDKEVGDMRSGIDRFTYVQWDAEYAVTVRHVKQVNTEVYSSDRYDVQFFKHTSSKVPVWTKFVSNDPATMSGYVGGKYHHLKGHDMGVTVQKGNYAVPAYRAVDVSIVPGMPGGPVTNDSGEVIGMTTELGLEPLEYGEGTYNVSYYLPYEVIAKEWKNYQLIKAGEDPIK